MPRIDSDSDDYDRDDDFVLSEDELPSISAATANRPQRDKGKGRAVNPSTAPRGNTKDVSSQLAKAKTKRTNDGQGYAWEEEYKRSWDVVREDESGSLESSVNDFLLNAKRRRIPRDVTSIQRGIIRHLYLVVDLSLSMTDRDLRPSRLELTLNYAQEFVTEFFDQNPISQMGILSTKDGIAERLSALSGNPVDHQKALTNKRKLEASGEPSLQNALEMARSGLAHVPTHGSREVLVVFGSLTTCDPGNIHQTIEALEKARVRVTIIGLSAEISICKEICKRTKGQYGVVINETHFKDLFFNAVQPPATVHTSLSGTAGKRSAGASSTTTSADLIQMGFPTLLSATSCPIASLCSCHAKLKTSGYLCPRCGSKVCDLPTDCGICGLTMVSAPHLARSYRHLFPVGNWKEFKGPFSDPAALPPECFGCSLPFPPLPTASLTNTAAPSTTQNRGANPPLTSASAPGVGASGRYECPRCKNHFCIDCDVFHEQLGLCPGCC